MLTLEHIGKIYAEGTSSELAVLQDLDWTVQRGEQWILTGRNGAGKTTLLRIMGLVDRRFTGTYRIDGVPVSSLSSKAIAALRADTFGFVFQDEYLLDDETVRENMEIPLLYSKKWRRSDRRRRIGEVAEMLTLSDLLGRKVGKLSGGQRQLVAIGRAMVTDPEVLLLDEPTNALSEALKTRVLEGLDAFAKAGKIVIMVTHDPIAMERTGYPRRTLCEGRLAEAERESER